MKNFVKILVIPCFFTFCSVGAQQVVKKDTINGTETSMTMDGRINELLGDMEANCSRSSSGSSAGGEILNTTTAPKILVPSKPQTYADICKQNPKILGYKIQLVIVKSNEEANKVKAYFRNRFPTIKVETDASLRPNYKVLAGSYFTEQSASEDLAKIRQYFKSATPVQYRVFCVESK